jgi:fimbrial chaperone protein
VRIFFDSKNRTNILTIKNNAEESVTLQLRAYSWIQTETGENLYSPTKDIIFFPKILTIKKDEKKIVRLGTRVQRGEHEKTYRLYIEEIPPPKTLDTTAVRIIMKVGVPMFITPFKAKPKGSIKKIELVKGRLSITLKNEGNVHFIIKSLTVKGYNTSEEEVFKGERGGGYIIREGTKIITFDIPERDCRRLKTLKISVDTDRISMSGNLDVHKKMCGP